MDGRSLPVEAFVLDQVEVRAEQVQVIGRRARLGLTVHALRQVRSEARIHPACTVAAEVLLDVVAELYSAMPISLHP